MKFLKLLLYLFVSSFLQGCISDEDASIELNDDILGLIVFKSELKDPSSNLQSWNQDDSSPCSWKFIQCNPTYGRVSHVSLDGLGLSGKIGIGGLQKLQHLKVLSLSYNNFTGDINPELGLIPSLESLNLSHNTLSGRITPPLLNLNMKFLDLSENSLSGPVPDQLFDNCVSLQYLSLAGNILEGPIPKIKNCSYLNTLNLSRNHFSGDLDFVSGSRTRIWSLKRLRTLDLSNNSFSGSIPQGVAALGYLKELLLQGNQFSGQLPADIGFCTQLARLDVSNNLFTGQLPGSLGLLNSMSFISLSNNMLTGDFPHWIGNISALEFLDLSDNYLTGSIPSSLLNCKKLSVIRLRGNRFNGSIPEGLFDLGLEVVDFSGNGFVGSIPPAGSSSSSTLRTMDLSSNDLVGEIPAEMGIFANLRYLNLSSNHLCSRMPLELGYFHKLIQLDLRNNAFYGSIPGDICKSRSLDTLQLDGNSLTGPIPQEIGNCSSLYLLTLSHNNLSGSIPRSISNLTKLKILKLEFNELSGEIPQEMGKLESLLAVNVSYNRLTGRLPVGSVFPILDQSALQGNLGICSPLLKGPCKMKVPKPLVLDPDGYTRNQSHSSSSNHHMFFSVSAIVSIIAATLIAFGVIVISLLNVSTRRRLAFVDTALESICSSSSRSVSLAAGKLILFESRSSLDSVINPETLLEKAAEIGEGTFGTVYKVSLGTQGRAVAFKKLVTSEIIQRPEDFAREVRVLGKARHPNLISLEGYYWTPQLKLLVSDYAPNGSLQAKLHDSTPPLSWANRFKVILGTAKALAYLHHSFRPPIIHYNLKPSNILLDENYNPKISDFGQARLLTKLDKHVMSNRFQCALGYVAPELTCQSLRVNEKCDIYGFGVLILEIVTGKRPVEYGEDNVVILSEHVRVLVEEGNVLDSVDPSMGGYPEDEVLPVFRLALVCASHVPSSRPSMAEIVQILQVIKTSHPQRMDIF